MKYPLLATRGIVVFPKKQSKLTVGRKESLNALDFSELNSSMMLVLATQKNAMKENLDSKEDLYEIATLVEFAIENETSKQKNIIVTGIKRVKINKLSKENDSFFVDVTAQRTIQIKDDNLESEYIKNLSDLIVKYSVGNEVLQPNIIEKLSHKIDAEEITNLLAHNLPFSYQIKAEILSENSLSKRLDRLILEMSKKIKFSVTNKKVDNKIRNNLEKQQNEFMLREKLKVIKEELGDISSKDDEIDNWKEELNNKKKYPKKVLKVLEKEIKKYESTPTMSPESGITRNYIEWILKLPWNDVKKEKKDLAIAQQVLDKSHFGLEKVKERIIEHLAVGIHTNNSSAPILTLLGPPGVGKTSLVSAIAEATDREFIKISLGGVKDESEIRGHRKTYIGAMPGKIISALSKAKSSNPIILLDEIDKMASDFRGDPASAMLEVLDPEQNKKFQDNYLEIEYDLSNVMFIATANYHQGIPSPLLDRVEVLQLSQYTLDEKVKIAKEYIIPKIIKKNILPKSQFKISDKVIEYVIDKYTMEAGVRGLTRAFDKLARKIVVKKVNKKLKGPLLISKKIAKEFLGHNQVYKEKLNSKKSSIGVTNAMYYSEVGGGTFPIEVTSYPAKGGGLKLTGQVQDVMQESFQISVAYLRSNAKKFGFKFDFDENIVQVHVPDGSTPKDGPSAGVTFTTAVLSMLLNKPVPNNIAMTGEISLRGKVMPIGGLKEKTLGSVQAGINKIFFPKANKNLLHEVTDYVKNNAELIMISDYYEIAKHIFNI
ncbi:MAG: endopeptidase La [Mollicutes bacterium PWAP]|nr:endopeptidase La [Mollicutes bacterium PWAP]